MPNGNKSDGIAYKYVIECQSCSTSLTMIYGTRDPDLEVQGRIKQHLVDLMIRHLENDPEPDDHTEVDKDPGKIITWIKTIRSPPEPSLS